MRPMIATMSSPIHRPTSSIASPGRRDSKGAAFRRGELKISDPIQFPHDVVYGPSQHFTVATLTNPPTTLNPQLEGTWPRKSVSPAFHTRTRSNAGQESQSQPVASDHATARLSAGPSMLGGSLASAPSKGSLNKPKDGGFRARIRRMFGSRRLRETSFSTGIRGHQSYIDPANLTSVEERPTRTHSQPVSELTRSSALGSHSPKPLEQLEVNQHDPSTLKPTDAPTSQHRRRNTLPSVALSFHEAQALAATLGDVGMRPSSKPSLHHSDSQLARNLKRRSRSADELRDEARSHQMSPIQWRRRSGEIQYWRNSIIENPLPEPSSMRREAYKSLESDRSPFRSFAPSPSSIHPSPSRDSLKQFRFGSFAAAGTASIEQRLTTLEVKFIDHEYAIAELQGCNIAKPITPAKAPKRRSVQDIFPETDDRQTTPAARRGRTFLSSPTDSPTPADDFDNPTQQHRYSNAPTLRPITSIGPSPVSPPDHRTSANPTTRDQFDSLMALLAAECAARRELEDKVAELQAQVEELRSATYVPRRPSAYPTPSPESRHSTLASFRGGQQPSTRRPLGFARSRVGSDETSRFSATDADDSDAEDGFLDTFETPRETQDSRFGLGSERGSPTAGMI